ncbi:MAG: aldehyde dehydrogenase family protein [Acidobacteria bacterium]|nr:aldehyde dehydrogenase family protein [Acidobacteriota bacterium]
MKTGTIDADIATLNDSKTAWARLPVPEKIELLLRLRAWAGRQAERWVRLACEAKGLAMDSPLSGEEWTSGPWAFIAALNETMEVLGEIARSGAPRLGAGSIRTRPDGQVVVKVFPHNLYDSLLLNGVRGEVWMQPGVTPNDLSDTMAPFYRRSEPEGRVALVLGAGNISSITPLDMLCKLMTEGQVCMVKMNPVNDYLGPVFEEIFGELVDRGFVRFAYGGADVGAYLTSHPGIEEIHMTGSESTFNAIVFGTGPEGEANRKAGRKINDRPMTAELGGVGPTIVVPGPWTEADIRFQAENIVTQKLHNTGCNCVASQVLVLPRVWEHSGALLDAVKDVIRSVPPRKPYYPGMDRRQHKAATLHPNAELLDDPAGTPVPRTMICDLDPEDRSEYCFSNELFGAVLCQTSLPGATPAAFLANAVQFANETLRGTLGANIIIHPKTLEELGPRFEDALAELRYGGIGVNCWVGLVYLLARATWGAFPGHPDEDIQSGRGVVHNVMMFENAEKSIAYAPFRPFPRTLLHGAFHLSPKPPWFVTNRQAHVVGRRLTRFVAHPGPHHLPGIFAAALRG